MRAEAEAMFKAIATRQGLRLIAVDNPHVELEMQVPGEAEALPVTLGLQNGDELNFGVGPFWSSFFPFASVRGVFEKAAEGRFTGQTRLVEHWRGRRLVRIDMQVRLKDGTWQRIYRQYCTILAPFWTTRQVVVSRVPGLQAAAT